MLSLVGFFSGLASSMVDQVDFGRGFIHRLDTPSSGLILAAVNFEGYCCCWEEIVFVQFGFVCSFVLFCSVWVCLFCFGFVLFVFAWFLVM